MAKRVTVKSRLLAMAAFALLALGGGAAFYLAPMLLEPNRYAQVVSIEQQGSYRDPRLMAAAWQKPVAALYRPRSYIFQHNQSFCGPASLVNLLRSIGVSASQDQVLDGTDYEPSFGILIGGLTLDQLADLARRHTGRPTYVLRDLSLESFRAELPGINDPRRRYIANFHRGPLFGRGHGHFSPLLAYLPAQDLVLVGDVNADYKPFLVRSEQLWRAIDTIDKVTGRKRGLILVSVAPR